MKTITLLPGDDCARQVAAEYSDIQADDRIIDNLCMQLVVRPEQFDVLLLENLYGDIVSDLCAGLVGGLGVVPGANLGENGAVFEAVHGSAPTLPAAAWRIRWRSSRAVC
ncbi:MAG TPA: isocitrate/isopropylmalate family dehydrogenase [Thermoanaerobaculia bacterium]